MDKIQEFGEDNIVIKNELNQIISNSLNNRGEDLVKVIKDNQKN